MTFPRLLVACAGATVAALALIAAGGRSYGTARAASPSPTPDGAALYAASCASCHGADGQGTDFGPTLVDVGAAAADFQLRTGRMPYAEPPGQQARRKPPAFDDAQIRALVAQVASFGDGPAIPTVTTDPAKLSKGQQLFVANCAPCHGATANGGAVGGGAVAPGLGQATALQVAEAMIAPPGQMPAFPLPADQRDAIATYVEYARDAPNPGGFSIGGIGPVPEGFVAWLLGVGALVAIAVLIGRPWTRKGGDEEHVG